MNVRVWDLPTRLFHWLTVLCFAGLVITGEVAGDAMVWHFRFGYVLLSLVLFRLIWGFVGGYWSRFSNFVPSPRGLLRYLRGGSKQQPSVGHNPLGALSVLAILGFLVAQMVSGLMSDDEIFVTGPLVAKVSAAWVQAATYFHTEIGEVALIALSVLHVAAIIWYRFKHNEKLLSAMLSGDKVVSGAPTASRDAPSSRLLALVLYALCAMAVAALLWWAALPSAGST